MKTIIGHFHYIRSHQSNVPLTVVLFLCFALIFSWLCGLDNRVAMAQSAREQSVESPSMGTGSAGASTTIGGTGFKVPIPEIRMNRIIGEAPPKKAPTESRRGPVSSPSDMPEAQVLHPEEPGQLMERPGPIPMRLPFDSRNRIPTAGPVEALPSIKEETSPEESEPQTVREAPPRPSLHFRPPEKIERLPDPEDDIHVRESGGHTPEVPEQKPSPAERPHRQEPHSPPFKGPIAPVNITDSLPEPPKEIISKRMIPLPHISEVEVARDTIKSLPVETQALDKSDVEIDSIPLDTRRAPLLVEIEEPQPVVETKEELSTKAKPVEESKLADQIKHEPMTPPDTGQTFSIIPPKESRPALEIKQQKEDKPAPKEDPQETEQTIIPQKERIPSPLDNEVSMTPEVRRYLKETAPVLEELSLLMARTPSLSIADFDPTEINGSILPKEINIKMESMKRELRILDSRVFSIIPPDGYAQYHNLIRQSINHTYVATESFVNFFNESKMQDLVQAKDHLLKAREYIKRTVE